MLLRREVVYDWCGVHEVMCNDNSNIKRHGQTIECVA
jgi:hypothetical protein